ncbi:MAG: zf-HC2 domain-containing protein [Cyanobacteria bacterium REEB67]|nr:zf-HC2 domain-containing protein [Cyanobacteria bacterium REEB67]
MSDLNKANCQQVSEMLGAFRDMELDLADVETVESHLLVCPSCREDLAAIEKVVASLQSLPDLPSRDFADLIEARINGAVNGAVSVQMAPVISAAPAEENVAAPAALVPVGGNVVAFSRPRPRLVAFAAAATILLFGLVAQFSLSPQGPVEVAQAPKPVVTHLQKLESDKSSVPMTDDIVALYDEEGSGNGTDVGISTNEDGLYAIKL